MKYKGQLRKQIKKTGRTLIWISSQLDMPRQTFWRKANSDTFTNEEKQKISKLLK